MPTRRSFGHAALNRLAGTTGVQVHGMYLKLLSEPGRSPLLAGVRKGTRHSGGQGLKTKFGALMHHFNRTNLAQALSSLRASAASGIDHVCKQDDQQNAEEHLEKLQGRLRHGNWVAKPAPEVLIPKPQGGTRPLAIGCIEDKIGFRRNKSAHQALLRLCSVIAERRHMCVVVEMDIEKFFNSMSRSWLVQQMEKRIGDKRFLNLIGRMLEQSVLKADGQLAESSTGTPQGSPVSPVLVSICLHYLLDDWFQKNWAHKAEFVRYADDAVFVFTNQEDASAFQTALAARLDEATLKLNLDKSGIIPFSCNSPKGSVGFLGFELYWGRDGRKTRVLKVKTQPKKLHRNIDAFTDWIKSTRKRFTTKKLLDKAAQKLRGHFNYFGVMWNEAQLSYYHFATMGDLLKWLNRRSQERSLSWTKTVRKLEFSSVPRPKKGHELLDICSEIGSERKHKLMSRMRKLRRTSGSARSAGRKPAFT